MKKINKLKSYAIINKVGKLVETFRTKGGYYAWLRTRVDREELKLIPYQEYLNTHDKSKKEVLCE
jgi:hypothetical protein